MFIARLDMSNVYSERAIIYQGFSSDRNSAILKAVKEYILYGYGECRFPAYILVKGKETLSEDDVLQICKLFRNAEYSIETEEIDENFNAKLGVQEFEDKEFYYKDNALYITANILDDRDVVEITEEQSARIEDIKYDRMTSINEYIPLWAAKYLYNNTDDEGLKDALISMSDLKFFL
jgi:hypothetical protein